jgi:hypothetical protein
MKKLLITQWLIIAAIGAISAQASNGASQSRSEAAQSSPIKDSSTEVVERLSFARASAEYPVTPADIYTLTYRRSTASATASDVQ